MELVKIMCDRDDCIYNGNDIYRDKCSECIGMKCTVCYKKNCADCEHKDTYYNHFEAE